ncbi:hypothetical protein V6N13_061523 [Hibiscus sabdariffa]
MPCLVPQRGGDSVTRHEHWAKGRDKREKGASAYPGVIITTCTSHLGAVERGIHLLSHSTTFVPIIYSLIERSSEGQPAHTANGEDGTTGQRPSGENVPGTKRGRPAPGEHSIGRKGEPVRWKSQGRLGHLTEIEGFSPIIEGPMK